MRQKTPLGDAMRALWCEVFGHEWLTITDGRGKIILDECDRCGERRADR